MAFENKSVASRESDNARAVSVEEMTMIEGRYRDKAEYYWQMQMGMIATGLTEGIFVSYDPRMPEGKKVTGTLITLDEDSQEIIDEKLTYAGELFLSITK